MQLKINQYQVVNKLKNRIIKATLHLKFKLKSVTSREIILIIQLQKFHFKEKDIDRIPKKKDNKQSIMYLFFYLGTINGNRIYK